MPIYRQSDTRLSYLSFLTEETTLCRLTPILYLPFCHPCKSSIGPSLVATKHFVDLSNMEPKYAYAQTWKIRHSTHHTNARDETLLTNPHPPIPSQTILTHRTRQPRVTMDNGPRIQTLLRLRAVDQRATLAPVTHLFPRNLQWFSTKMETSLKALVT